MIRYINKIVNNLWLMRAIVPSIIFNFCHLPYKQAIKLPILIYKPRFRNLWKGEISIDGMVHFGMIQLGRMKIPMLPNSGLKIHNAGKIIFKGKCFIGNASAISVAESGVLVFGNNVCITAGAHIVCYKRITISDQTLIGWNCTIMDTDLHKISYTDGTSSKGYNTITIGSNCWIGMGCTVLKGVHLPDHIIVASNSILRKTNIDIEPYSILGSNSRIEVFKRGAYRDSYNDIIDYSNE